MTDPDPKMTFDTFVVGPANRLASAAARRAADSPGTSYNPLFMYSASGLGKSHILTAISHQAQRVSPDRKVEYMALETYLERLESALESGSRDGFKDRYGDLEILLLDDVQFLTGQPEAQEMLLRTLDQLSTAGSQIVLASDRPPADINGLDARLLSRFSGGLIVDIGAPEYETRVAIIRKKAGEAGHSLQAGVAEALARYPFKNVRELGGSLNKVLATQDLEDREVTAAEVAEMMGSDAVLTGESGGDEFGSFLDDLAVTVAEKVEEQEEDWRKEFRETIDSAERHGFSVRRLQAFMGGEEPPEWEKTVATFRADLDRLGEIDHELDHLGNPWPEAAEGILKDPDRLEEAEALLASVRERQRPFPRLGDGPDLNELSSFPSMAVKAARQLIGPDRPQYNPLYLWANNAALGKTLLGATGRLYQAGNPTQKMAVTSVTEFAEDFIRALSDGVAGAWRERWWTVDLLLVHGLQALSETERAQDEFFHLFEALKRRGARVMLVADRQPSDIQSIDDRLRSRFEGGLVLEVAEGAGSGDLDMIETPAAVASESPFVPAAEEQEEQGAGVVLARKAAEPAPEAAEDVAPEEVAPPVEEPRRGGAWFPSAENVVIQWPRIDDLLLEELEG